MTLRSESAQAKSLFTAPATRKSARILLGLILLAALVRAVQPTLHPVAYPDSWDYLQMASTRADTGQFSMEYREPFRPSVVRETGYPFFLWISEEIAGRNRREVFALVLQIIISLALVWLIPTLLPSSFQMPERLVTGAVLALSAPIAFFSTTLLTEGLYTFFLPLGVLLLSKIIDETVPNELATVVSVAGAAFLSVAALLRSEALGYSLLLAFGGTVWLLARRVPHWKSTAIAAGILVVTMMAVATRNWRVSGNWVLRDSTAAMSAIWISLPGAAWTDFAYRVPFEESWGPSERSRLRQRKAVIERISDEVARRPIKFFTERIIHIPRIWLRFGTAWILAGLDDSNVHFAKTRARTAFRVMALSVWGILPLVLVGIGFAILIKEGASVFAIAVASYGVFVSAVGLLLLPDPRYAVTAKVLLAPLVGKAIVWVFKNTKRIASAPATRTACNQ